MRILSAEAYQEIVLAGNDFCECCGGLWPQVVLYQGKITDHNDQPQDSNVCKNCVPHCEERGPCNIQNCVVVPDKERLFPKSPQPEE